MTTERELKLEEHIRDLRIQIVELEHQLIFLQQTIDDMRRDHRLSIGSEFRSETASEGEFRERHARMSAHIRNQERSLASLSCGTQKKLSESV